MDWFKVDGSLRDHEKWRDLSPAARGAWITLMTIAHGQPGAKRWTLGKPDHVRSLLRREGFDSPLDLDVLADLVAAHLVDIDESDGTVSMHDAVEHQNRAANAERQQRWRDKEKAKRNTEPQVVTPPIRAVTHNERQDKTKETRETERDNGTDEAVPVPLDQRPTNLIEAIRRLTGQTPSDKEQAWVDDLCKSYGREHISRALWDVKGARTPAFLLSRVTHHFRDGEPLNKEAAS